MSEEEKFSYKWPWREKPRVSSTPRRPLFRTYTCPFAMLCGTPKKNTVLADDRFRAFLLTCSVISRTSWAASDQRLRYPTKNTIEQPRYANTAVKRIALAGVRPRMPEAPSNRSIRRQEVRYASPMKGMNRYRSSRDTPNAAVGSRFTTIHAPQKRNSRSFPSARIRIHIAAAPPAIGSRMAGCRAV